jgi:hypothetical protein
MRRLVRLEQQEIVRTSRINLSTYAACDAGAEPSWGLPERCYGVPASGGFLLADRRRHAPEDFADGERAEYEDLEECVAKSGTTWRISAKPAPSPSAHRRARRASTATGTAQGGC